MHIHNNEESKPKQVFDFKELYSWLKNVRGVYFAGFIFMLAQMILGTIQPFLTRALIDDVIMQENFEALNSLLLIFAGTIIAQTAVGYFKEYMFDISGNNAATYLRCRLFGHLQTLSFSFFDKTNTGEIMSRMKHDIDRCFDLFNWVSFLSLEMIFSAIIPAIMMFTISWQLSLLTVAVLPVVSFLAMIMQRKLDKLYGKISDQEAKINTVAQESLAGVRLVKGFGREAYQSRKFGETNKVFFGFQMEQARIISVLGSAIGFIIRFSLILITTIGGILIINHNLTPGELIAFMSFAQWLAWPLEEIGWMSDMLSECFASVKKLTAVLKEEPAVKSPENPITPPDFRGGVRFDSVSFGYSPDTLVLRDISFDIKPGGTLGIMGLTGAGKSSVIQLLARFYDADKGSISIDGANVRELELGVLREQISYVMQDPFLFSESIAENIALGCPDASPEEIKSAAAAAVIADFIEETEEKYDTVIGERGIGLSGGQKQRISIARALLRQSCILVLDDATSALDMETEYELQKQLESYSGKTKIIIAHRISAVKNADEILIIENGEITERGNHSELMAKKGYYYKTCQSQFDGLLDEGTVMV